MLAMSLIEQDGSMCMYNNVNKDFQEILTYKALLSGKASVELLQSLKDIVLHINSTLVEVLQLVNFNHMYFLVKKISEDMKL